MEYETIIILSHALMQPTNATDHIIEITRESLIINGHHCVISHRESRRIAQVRERLNKTRNSLKMNTNFFQLAFSATRRS